MVYFKHVAGVGPVPMTPEEEVAWHAEQDAYTPPDPWIAIRAERDARLAATDWYTLRAWEQGNDPPSNVAEYRQALRDITLQPDPLNLVWPNEPI